MEPSVRVAPTPTRPGADERLPRADHLPRVDEAIIPEQLPGVEPLAAGACINPCIIIVLCRKNHMSTTIQTDKCAPTWPHTLYILVGLCL